MIMARYVLLAAFFCAPAWADISVIVSCDKNARTEQSKLLSSLSSHPSNSPYRFQAVQAGGRIWPLRLLYFCDFHARLPDGDYKAELAGDIPGKSTGTLAVASFMVRNKNIIVKSQSGSIALARGMGQRIPGRHQRADPRRRIPHRRQSFGRAFPDRRGARGPLPGAFRVSPPPRIHLPAGP